MIYCPFHYEQLEGLSTHIPGLQVYLANACKQHVETSKQVDIGGNYK